MTGVSSNIQLFQNSVCLFDHFMHYYFIFISES